MFKPVNLNENFPEMEKKWLKHWYEKGIVKKYLNKNKDSKKYFSFQDGPITANNPMGVHHAWGRTYKDLWPRFYNLLGFKQRFQNGFDCQGLWVEVEVEKELGLHSKKDIENLVPGDPKASIARFVQLCKDRVIKFSGIQTEQSKRLGYFADWDHSYFTMADENNYMIWKFLKVCHDNGWIYKGHESVPWCPRCETAISQHEMLTEDYKELVHESVYLALPVVKRKAEYLLIWTTTPWTIPANIAVAVNKNYDYSLVEGVSGELFWIANDLIKAVFGKDYKKIVKTVKGRELVGLKYDGPFDDIPAVKKVKEENPDKFHIVIATDELILPISLTEGTGMVHTAVSAGVEDFKLGKKNGLTMISVIEDNADYRTDMGFLAGKNAKKHPEIILDYLREKKLIFKTHQYKHRYPACWRCKTVLVWKVEDEWYIAMDKPGKNQKSKIKDQKENETLRNRMIKVAKQIKWMPEFGLDRELDWLKNMHDWLISKKNRYWGLALPIYECKGCGTFEVVGSKDELKKRAVSGWSIFEGHSPHKPFIDEVTITCKKCNKEVKRIDDVGNPWLDAGIVPYSTIMDKNQGEPLYLGDKEKWKDWFPANFITESFPGQFKNWFYAMIAMSSVLENTNPFERVLGYGTMLGEDGRAMHKSWGNSIEFNEGADKIGVDVMRWMFARQNPADNMLFGYKKADEVRRQFYLMLWNVNKFFVEYANLDKFEVQDDKINLKSKNILDTWILSRLASLIDHTEKSFREFNAKEAALSIEKFVADVSTWFIRRSRDRVWVNSDDTNDKQYFYTTLRKILIDLSIIISPIVPFISEMIFTNLTDYESVHLTYWPKTDSLPKPDDKMFVDMEIVREMAEAGQRARKEQKIKVRQPLNSVRITAPVSKKFHIEAYREEYLRLLRLELNVKKVELGISKDDVIYVQYDIILTEELKFEGKLRELMREIQSKRKELGTKPDQFVILTLPKDCMKFAEFLRKKILAHKIEEGNELNVSL